MLPDTSYNARGIFRETLAVREGWAVHDLRLWRGVVSRRSAMDGSARQVTARSELRAVPTLSEMVARQIDEDIADMTDSRFSIIPDRSRFAQIKASHKPPSATPVAWDDSGVDDPWALTGPMPRDRL